MIWRKRTHHEPTFVEAGPGFAERVATIWHDRRGPGRWFRLIFYVGSVPFRALGRGIASLFWWRSPEERDALRARRLRHLLEGLPAVVAAIAVASVAGVVVGRETYLRDVYRGEAAAAYNGDKPEEARLFYERLYRLDGGTAETRLFLGLTLEKLGQTDEALHLIQGVADGDAGGEPRANRWVAAKLLADETTFRDRNRLRAAYGHLVQAERGLPNDPDVKLALAKYHLALGETQKAVPKLAAAAATDASLNYDLARLYVAVGRTESARQAMERSEKHFRKELEERPEDRRARLLLSASVANLGRLEEAVALLREGLVQDPQGPYGPAIAKIYVSVHDRLAAQQPRDYRAMIGALREALAHEPRSVEAVVRLIGFGDPAGQGAMTTEPNPDADREARDMLQGLLATGEQPPAVHMALGLKAWRGEDLDTARWHFERAYDLEPSLAGVANNFAWVLAHQEKPDLDRALAVIGPVAEQFPNMPHFLDTRGEIYLRQQKWEEALRDFERALPALRENRRIHESLATVYDGLGRPEMAARHRAEAARLAPAAGAPAGDGVMPRVNDAADPAQTELP